MNEWLAVYHPWWEMRGVDMLSLVFRTGFLTASCILFFLHGPEFLSKRFPKAVFPLVVLGFVTILVVCESLPNLESLFGLPERDVAIDGFSKYARAVRGNAGFIVVPFCLAGGMFLNGLFSKGMRYEGRPVVRAIFRLLCVLVGGAAGGVSAAIIHRGCLP